MKNLLLDLWHDLREKRLWPVAAALLVGLVAVPVVLSKSAAPAPAPVPAPALEGAAAELPQLKNLTVIADTAASRGGSTLDTFRAKNPFRPPAVVLNAQKDKVASVATAPGLATAATDGGGAPSGGSGSGGGGGGAQGDPMPVAPAPGSPAPPTRRSFVYTADVKFGRSGREGNYRGLRKLEMLPSESNPLLIFLGVDASGDNAVFLVDAALKATGEGKCSPSPESCATLTIGAGSEHEFVDPDGRSYTLLVEEIRPVSISKASSSSKRRKPRARASVGASAPTRRFVPPVLADLVTVASPGGQTSSTDTDRR